MVMFFLLKMDILEELDMFSTLPEPSTVNSHVVVVRTKNNEIKSEFLYWFMNSHILSNILKSFTSGTTCTIIKSK